ncbi:DUF1289 domain-containing protein [Tatumella ptyseos]|nr:DUF1289 domain-containing protein [Tatumella ptyseos]WKX26932.1 DUF1289 domain-containing protein [Tatumella ptyseos]
MDSKTRWCEGCCRSKEEIKQWKKLSPYHQKILLNELPLRLDKIKNK